MKKTYLQFGIAFLLAFIISSSSGNVFGQTCPSGMIAYWKMEEGSGPIYDDFHSIHDAIATTASPSQTAGASGRAQAFNADGGTYLSIPDDPSFDWSSLNSFAMEFWVKYTLGSNVQVFVARDDRPFSQMTWWIGAEINGQISFYLQGSSGLNTIMTSGSSFADNDWHHVVAMRNGGNGMNFLYVDGVLQQSKSLSGFGNLFSSNPITIGNLLYVGSEQFHMTGAIDELAFYNRTLDPTTEITKHYNDIDQYQIGYCDGPEPKILTEPIKKATVNQPYVYDVDASGNPKPTYELIVKPTGMIINQNTGMITWTPMSQSVNGAVVVRATNGSVYEDQSFNIFIADAPVCRDYMIAYWDFDLAGSEGRIDKIAGYELTGSAPTTTTGISGSALSFNGANKDSLNMEDFLDPHSNIFFDWVHVSSFSIEVWVKSNFNPSNVMVLVGRDEKLNNSHYWLGINPGGAVGFQLRDYSGTNQAYIEGGSVLNGAWHHIVATYNSSSNEMEIWVDKIMVASTNQNFLNFGGRVPMNIGCLDTPSQQYWFTGVMDELAFYSTDLGQTQITDNYNNSLQGNGACIYNYAPVILSSPDSTVLQGTEYVYDIIATDINDGDPISLSLVSAPAWLDDFSYTPGDTTATLRGTPVDQADVGLHFVTVRVFDGVVNVDQVFQVRVVNENDPPEFVSSAPSTVDQGDTYTYAVMATDPDDDDLVYSAPIKPAWLDFNSDTHVLSGVPEDPDVGEHNITLRVYDGTVEVDQVFTITVNNTNDPPAFTSVPVTQTDQNALYSYTAVAEDPDDDDVLTYSAVQKPSWLNFNSVSHVLSGTPGGDDVGMHNITLRVTDGEEEVDQPFQLEVLDVNDPPQFTSIPPATVDEDSRYTYTVLATDPEGDAISYSAPQLPSWLSFNGVTRILSGTPGNDDVGNHDVIIRATDANAADNDQPFTITVNNVNDLPEFTSTALTEARIGQPYLYQITASDPDPGDQLEFTAVSIPDWLTLTPASTTAILSGTPQAADEGTHAIILQVSDGIEAAVQGFSVTVRDGTGISNTDQLVNRVYPNPSSDEVHFEFAQQGELTLKIMDIKGSVLKVVQTENTDHLTIDISDLSSDLYFYSVTIDELTSVGKLVKE